MKFIDRKAELEWLERRYRSNKPELLILYGRRRIGKTELLNRFLNDKKGLYFLSRLESQHDTLNRINNIFLKCFNDKDILDRPLPNFDLVFEYLAKRSKARFIFVIDEFPFLVERFPDILSVIQDAWDNKLSKRRLMLILCGSSVAMMERYTINREGPLFGRRTGQWKLEALPLCSLPQLFPKYSAEELITLTGAIGSIPGYLTKFNPGTPILQNIEQNLLTKGAYLYEEAEVLLREELRDPSNYLTILSAIAVGATSFNEIKTKTGLDKSMLSKYIYVLENLNLVSRTYPLTVGYKEKLKSRGIIVIRDNYFRFWLRYVYHYKDLIERNIPVIQPVLKDLPIYLSKVFEEFITTLLYEAHILGNFTRRGRWWWKDTEIDVVGLKEDKKEILFAECKWQDRINADRVVRELTEKAGHVNWFNDKRMESFAVFAKSFSKRINWYKGKKVHCFDLKDIERILRTK